MLSKNLNVTYAMVWSIALANIIGAGICFALSGQFAKLSTLRYSLILPSVLRHPLHRRIPGHAQLGRSLCAAAVRRLRLDDEAAQVAAAAADPRLRARRHHRALHVHLGRALRHRLDVAAGRHRPVRPRDLRRGAAAHAGHQDSRRRQGHDERLRAAEIHAARSVPGVPHRAGRRDGDQRQRLELRRQGRAADCGHLGTVLHHGQSAQSDVPGGSRAGPQKPRDADNQDRRRRSIWTWSPTCPNCRYG